jgi:hypothetical protein
VHFGGFFSHAFFIHQSILACDCSVGVRVLVRVHVVRVGPALLRLPRRQRLHHRHRRHCLPRCLPRQHWLRRGWCAVSGDELRVSAAIEAAEAGAAGWREAVHAQLDAAPDHSEFYALTAEVVDTLRSLSGMASVLGRQVADYGQGRQLRDDAGADPTDRLADAGAELALARHAVECAERAVNRFWSQIGHIGIAYRPHQDTDQTADQAAPGRGVADDEGDGS